MPALEVLYIYSDLDNAQSSPSDWVEPPCLPEIDLPRLREVTVPAELFPQFTACSLRHIFLGSLFPSRRGNLMAPAPRVLLQALHNCTNVEDLFLVDGTIQYDWPATEGVAIVPLPSLKTIQLSDTSGSSVLRMLNVLSIPPTALVRVDNLKGTGGLAELIPHHTFQRHPLHSVVLGISESLTCRLKGFAHHPRPLRILDVQCWGPLNNILAKDYFQTMPVTHLYVVDNSGIDSRSPASYSVDDWVVVLQAFPHLTHLVVCGARGPDTFL